MTGQRMRIAIIIFAAVFVFIAGWILMYPSASDPKNVTYVCWKAGLYKMDMDTAVGTMIGDAGRDKIVVGRTEAQLRNKFGYLLAPSDTSPYLNG